ncbi:MAG: FYDLN acid domain-containing protein [Lachnospiraceae bacterium]|nr:FYDLN acid domain-containing protein [Lachnospiraceae bacterium]
MYFVPDGTQVCGYYECEDCEMRFLDLRIAPRIVCPYCGEEVDMEIGPDDEMPQVEEKAVLVKVVEGDEVERMDGLLSLALTGGDFDWI